MPRIKAPKLFPHLLVWLKPCYFAGRRRCELLYFALRAPACAALAIGYRKNCSIDFRTFGSTGTCCEIRNEIYTMGVNTLMQVRWYVATYCGCNVVDLN
uniref:Secreted protein n=1 Tax=Romanomermis culicivorax TaxID=13658 RepID=A0A915JY89_ROMCU